MGREALERHLRALWPLPSWGDTARRQQANQGSIFSLGTESAGKCTWDCPASATARYISVDYKPPISGILLQQPKWTKTNALSRPSPWSLPSQPHHPPLPRWGTSSNQVPTAHGAFPSPLPHIGTYEAHPHDRCHPAIFSLPLIPYHDFTFHKFLSYLPNYTIHSLRAQTASFFFLYIYIQ